MQHTHSNFGSLGRHDGSLENLVTKSKSNN